MSGASHKMCDNDNDNGINMLMSTLVVLRMLWHIHGGYHVCIGAGHHIRPVAGRYETNAASESAHWERKKAAKWVFGGRCGFMLHGTVSMCALNYNLNKSVLPRELLQRYKHFSICSHRGLIANIVEWRRSMDPDCRRPQSRLIWL